MTLGCCGPMLGQRAAALEDDVDRIECLVEQGGDGALEPRSCAEVARTIPDEATVVAVDGEAGAYADVDSEKRGQVQTTRLTKSRVVVFYRGDAEVAEKIHRKKSRQKLDGIERCVQ